MGKIAWITGASSCLGLETLNALHQKGWTVVGGARSFGENDEEPGILRLHLDVTLDESVAAFADEAFSRFGAPDALINAAGVMVLGPAENISMDELHAVMDVNFLGMVRMTKAVLPLMHKNGGGRIVNFSSINGLLATPFQSAYVASKHAIEGWSECLNMEGRTNGIQVMLVEPGDHRGGGQKYRPHAEEIADHYRPAFLAGTATIARDEKEGGDPIILGKKVARALDRRLLPARLRVAKITQHMAVFLHDVLPSNLFLRALSVYYHRGGKV
ncbi:MAG: SDR family oxidoreductase [Eubacteriales bacterium]|jgi:NAD(P)-dependent dehydrogenase (short-subunit alcohol dehydrogenase family)|nr:SDR family oxidoreductase [Eubacteriales bacterium]MDD4104661.1 SDR family oxidoreductase [Eubacteriales bacterium]MDD4710610.1 SDR family oxidoreductase [Eubacteriales bacterium]